MADHRVESCFQAQLLCMQLRVATLRTVLVGFLTYGSSLSFRPCDRTRFLNGNSLAVDLLMTGWMEQDTVFRAV